MKLKEILSSKAEGGERGWWGSSKAKPSKGEMYLSLLHIYTRVSWLEGQYFQLQMWKHRV